jgi:uncharacterized protein (TIGR03000 family)
MFQKAFSFTGALLLAGAAVLMMPGLSQARGGGGHGGGGHAGGGHFGGGHSGGGHFAGGSFHGAYRGGWYGGHRGGWYGGGNYYGHHRYGGYGYYPYWGYGYYPYYGSYDSYYPYYDYDYPTYSGSYSTYGDVAADDGYSTPAPASGYQALYPSTATVKPDNAATISVKVPADAQVTFNGTPTTSTGTFRQFESPPLAAGKYAYDVQARWHENGKEVIQTRQIIVAPGAHVEVDFPTRPETENK